MAHLRHSYCKDPRLATEFNAYAKFGTPLAHKLYLANLR